LNKFAFVGEDAWCAWITNTDQFIQVDFPYLTTITRLSTYGRRTKLEWVTQYTLQYSDDEVKWLDYTENGFVKVKRKAHCKQMCQNVTKYAVPFF